MIFCYHPTAEKAGQVDGADGNDGAIYRTRTRSGWSLKPVR
jgi:hypothetical protein